MMERRRGSRRRREIGLTLKKASTALRKEQWKRVRGEEVNKTT